MDNHTLAQHLRKHARDLDGQSGNLYRVRAYRRAADVIDGLEMPVAELLERAGQAGLRELPGIGAHIGRTIENLLKKRGQRHAYIFP